jgi:hypothetical protein
MIQQLDKIFLGSVISEHRKYLADVLKHLKSKGYTRVTIPAVGQFGMVKAAIEAGFKPSEIYSSDISLFSSILGYVYANKPLDTLPISQNMRGELARTYDNDLDRAAHLLLLIKSQQLDESKFYTQIIFDDIMQNWAMYIKQLASLLSHYKTIYEGINYGILDLWETVKPECGIVIINPPVYSGGYEKMFSKAEEIIGFQSGIEQFVHKDFFESLIGTIKETETPIFITSYQVEKILPPENLLCVVEKSKNKFETLAINNVKWLSDYKQRKTVVLKKDMEFKASKIPIMNEDDEIRPDSKITFVRTTKEVGLYYRDLFAHRLGNTKAEIYLLMLIDGKVFRTVGLHCADMRRLTTEDIFETFGFGVYLKKYPHVNRLMMMSITCKEFKNFLLTRILGSKNQIYNFTGLKTTCLCKYRKNKLNSGVLDIVSREKLPNDTYKIVYRHDFYDRTYSDCINIYLSEHSNKPYGETSGKS